MASSGNEGQSCKAIFDKVEWKRDGGDVLAYRHESSMKLIKCGSNLIVDDGCAAVLTYSEGVSDVFLPGKYILTSSVLKKAVRAFGHEIEDNKYFSCDICFLDIKPRSGLEWSIGEGIPLATDGQREGYLFGRGQYGFRPTNPAVFLNRIFGNEKALTAESFVKRLNDLIEAFIREIVASYRINAGLLCSEKKASALFIGTKISEKIREYGFDLTYFTIDHMTVADENAQPNFDAEPSTPADADTDGSDTGAETDDPQEPAAQPTGHPDNEERISETDSEEESEYPAEEQNAEETLLYESEQAEDPDEEAAGTPAVIPVIVYEGRNDEADSYEASGTDAKDETKFDFEIVLFSDEKEKPAKADDSEETPGLSDDLPEKTEIQPEAQEDKEDPAVDLNEQTETVQEAAGTAEEAGTAFDAPEEGDSPEITAAEQSSAEYGETDEIAAESQIEDNPPFRLDEDIDFSIPYDTVEEETISAEEPQEGNETEAVESAPSACEEAKEHEERLEISVEEETVVPESFDFELDMPELDLHFLDINEFLSGGENLDEAKTDYDPEASGQEPNEITGTSVAETGEESGIVPGEDTIPEAEDIAQEQKNDAEQPGETAVETVEQAEAGIFAAAPENDTVSEGFAEEEETAETEKTPCGQDDGFAENPKPDAFPEEDTFVPEMSEEEIVEGGGTVKIELSPEQEEILSAQPETVLAPEVDETDGKDDQIQLDIWDELVSSLDQRKAEMSDAGPDGFLFAVCPKCGKTVPKGLACPECGTFVK